jgi:hypothetical protein
MNSNAPVRERKRPSPKFSFLMAALFALLAVWAGVDNVVYMVALLGISVIWAIQGGTSVRKARGQGSRSTGRG